MNNNRNFNNEQITSFLNQLYDSPLIRYTLPYSSFNHKVISSLANIYSNLLQNVVFYSHNNFEIEVWVEQFDEEESKIFICERDHFPASNWQLVLLYKTIYQIINDLDLKGIDLCKFMLRPNDLPQFPLILTDTRHEGSLKHVQNPFLSSTHFEQTETNLFPVNFAECYDYHDFNSDQIFFYCYDDFTSSFLNRFPFSTGNNKNGVKIKINTNNPLFLQMIKRNLFFHHNSSNCLFLTFENHDDNLPGAFNQVISQKLFSESMNDYVNIIDGLSLYMQHSALTSLILIVDRLKTREDIEFINFLLESPTFSETVIISLDSESSNSDFDLNLNENPKNLLSEYLNFQPSRVINFLNDDEINVLKIFSILPSKISFDFFYSLLPEQMHIVVNNLIKKGILNIKAGDIFLTTNYPHSNVTFPSGVKDKILLPLLEPFFKEFPLSELTYFILSKQLNKLKISLNQIIVNRVIFRNELNELAGKIKENWPSISERIDTELLEILIPLLIDCGELEFCKKVILNLKIKTIPPALKLHLAYIYKWEKDYKKVDHFLNEYELETVNQKNEYLKDEFHFLRFVYHEIISGAGANVADSHFKKIKSILFRQRASILLSDRFLFQNQFVQVESLLNRAIIFFQENHYPLEELEAQSHLAKLYREKRMWKQSETLYQNSFIKSQIKDFKLLSAYIAIDLGNLYWMQEKLTAADTWYNKAMALFQYLKNQNGIILAKSNLVEVKKIKGDWGESKKYLEAILLYNKNRNAFLSLAIDYFNIGHLEYLKHRFSSALKFIQIANSMFQKNNCINYAFEGELLKAKITFLDNALHDLTAIDLTPFYSTYKTQLQQGDKKEVYFISALNLVLQDTGNRNYSSIVEKLKQISSKSLQFELITLLVLKYRTQELLDILKELSIDLSYNGKNYYYFEYYYIYFSYFLTTKEIPEKEHELFNEIYWFFHQNRRNLNPTIHKYKELLDSKTLQYDIFKSAELVNNSLQWKIPEDFFNSLVTEIQSHLPVDFINLTLYDKSSNPDQPLFCFAYCQKGDNKALFSELSLEIASRAFYTIESLNLNRDDIKQNFTSNEKVFYFYNHTKVIFWKLAESFFGILILAFNSEEYKSYDFFERHNDLFNKFGPLIYRFYETDFKLNKKLEFIIGESSVITNLKEKILKVSKVDFSVLIRGESGSGKELVAKAVHLLSNRYGGPFIPVNAAAIPENLLEAELFGYKKGAFTGASENKAGLIETANNGSLFLDEIADLPINLQAKLLRVLQESEIRRLGENKTQTVNIRLICATNKDLNQLISQGQFREDLYFRIQDLTLQVPPLRERPEDIPLLVRHFLKKYNFDLPDTDELQHVINSFKSRVWHGNVRELESNVKRLITYYPDINFELDMKKSQEDENGLISIRENIEKTLILKALKQNNGNRTATAESLKISRQYLLRLLKRHKINSA